MLSQSCTKRCTRGVAAQYDTPAPSAAGLSAELAHMPCLQLLAHLLTQMLSAQSVPLPSCAHMQHSKTAAQLTDKPHSAMWRKAHLCSG